MEADRGPRSGAVGAGRRIIWIDDDLGARAIDTDEWLAAHEHVLAIAPATLVGLTHDQLDQVEAWL